ncbi:hypothetical protein LUZ60_011573 [Juncus effusus]|nr:hypothetical protein LUZ60_011573 [Juncus effusus]
MNHHPQFLNDELLYKIPNLERQTSMPSSLLNFVGTMSKSSLLSIDLCGRILFSGSGAEMKDLLSILSEFDLYNKSPAGSKAALLFPYFERSGLRGRAANNISVLKFPTDTLAPLKSPGTLRTKPTKKKQNKNTMKNRDIFQQNYFHAFESLLSVLLDKKINNTNTNTNTDTGSAILLLKKSGPKIADILTQFSIGIAGTGLAVLLSVACKRAPLCATRVLSTSFGFGLFWFCSAVNGLRDTIVEVFKMSN